MKTKLILSLFLSFIFVHVFSQNSSNTSNEDDTILITEELPHFVGGDTKLLEYLKNELRYPENAKKDRAEGIVIVSFVIFEDGSINDVSVLKSVHPELDAEAVRCASSMPNWIPGKQNGKAVKVQYYLPLKFLFKE